LFVDVIVLDHVSHVPDSTGYSTLEYIEKRFGITPRSGSIFSTMDSLERKGLLEGGWKGKARIYRVTDGGREALERFGKGFQDIQELIEKLSG